MLPLSQQGEVDFLGPPRGASILVEVVYVYIY
jgi:hypothetical protein